MGRYWICLCRENGNRAVSPRDVRDLCALYGVTDQQIIDTLLAMAMAVSPGSRAGGTPTGDLTSNLLEAGRVMPAVGIPSDT